MNIIEHVWNYLDRQVRTGDPLHHNPAELWAALLEEWDGIKGDYVEELFESMPRRVQALLAAKGQCTLY